MMVSTVSAAPDQGALSSAVSAEAELASSQPPIATMNVLRITPVLLFPVALVMLGLTFWSVDIVTPALPTVRDSLRLSGTGAGLVVSLYFIGRLLVSIPAGIVNDRVGSRWTALLGAAILLAGSVIAATAQGQTTLLIGRTIQGMSLAFLISALMLSVVRARPGDGVALMIMNVGAGIGSGCGLIASGLLTGLFSWRAVFWASAVLALVMVALTLAFRATSGTATTAAGQLDPSQGGPGLPLKNLLAPIGVNLIIQGSYGVFLVAMPLYAAWRYDASAGRIGALLLTNTVTHLTVSVLTVRLIRRYGGLRVMPFGLTVAAIGLVGILLAPIDLFLTLPLACYAGGQVAASIAAGDWLLTLAGRGARAVSLVRLTTDVSQVVGPAAVGVLADAAGYPTPLAVMAGLTAVGVMVGLHQLRAHPTT